MNFTIDEMHEGVTQKAIDSIVMGELENLFKTCEINYHEDVLMLEED